jgi:hypothetical protein
VVSDARVRRDCSQAAMPLALREFYEFAGTGKRAFVINDLLAPDEIWTDAGRVF